MWTPGAGHSTQKQTVSSWLMEDTSITPAVPTSGSTVWNPNLLVSSCLICSEKLLNEVPTGFCFFLVFVTPMSDRDQWTECKYCKVHLHESIWRIPQDVGGEGLLKFPLPTDSPNVSSGSHCQSLGAEVKLPFPNCLWHQTLANSSLALLSCFNIWTTIFFIRGILCCCSIETVKNWHLKTTKLLL